MTEFDAAHADRILKAFVAAVRSNEDSADALSSRCWAP
jgi:hypothetical protein